VAEDARRDRVYLPASRLAAHGLTSASVLDGSADPHRLARVVAEISDLADRYYASADDGVRDIPWRYRHGVLVLARFYRAAGHRAARRFGTGARHQTLLPWWERAVRMLEVFLVSWEARMIGWDAPGPHAPELHRAIAGWAGADPAAG